jgi:hypothetical protein
MAELYRHWKAPFRGNGELARVGVYAGCFELLVEAAQRSDRVPSWLWVFDAIPQYFLLYTFDGAGFLRDPAIAKPPRLLTPVKECLESIKRDGRRQVRCDDEVVSREVLVPIPEKRDGELIFRREFVPFLDGVVDIRRRQELIKKGVIVPLLA